MRGTIAAIIIAVLVMEAAFSAYLIDRPRERKTTAEGVCAVVELGLIALGVYFLWAS